MVLRVITGVLLVKSFRLCPLKREIELYSRVVTFAINATISFDRGMRVDEIRIQIFVPEFSCSSHPVCLRRELNLVEETKSSMLLP